MDRNPEGNNGARREYLLRAVSPSLFSASRCPDLITSLLLANLMSPKLWELAGRISNDFKGHDGLDERMRLLQRYVDKHFFMASPAEFCRIWGLYEPDMAEDSEAASSGFRTMSAIRDALEKKEGEDIRKELLEYGVAPRYVYPTVDVMMAYAKVQGHSKNHSRGLVSCLDGCVLIASLALALGLCRMEDIIFVGSPFHYTLYVFPDGCGYMFNAKREILTRSDWLGLTGDVPDVSCNIFINKLLVCDRVITPFGSCVFPEGYATISPSWMKRMAEKVSWFLDAVPPEISLAVEAAEQAGSPGISGAELAGGALPAGRQAFEEAVLKNASGDGGLILEASLYAFRHPDVSQPGLYREAAMRGFRSYILSGLVLSVEDAQKIAEGIAGTESVYGDASRIAMPDEVLLFNTADSRERELLVETLLRHAGLW